MAGNIPHSKIVNQHLRDYLDEAESIVSQCAKTLPSEPSFRAIYKISLAGFTVLWKFGHERLPLVRSCAGVFRRVPFLVASRQIQLSYIELRRAIESAVGFVYFCEHPVEWREFLARPSGGYATDTTKPISWCAHREMRWYWSYSKERYEADETGLIQNALDDLSRLYKELSVHVHAGIQTESGEALTDPFDEIDSPALGEFSKIHRRTVRAIVILALATLPDSLSKLNAVERAWFDWILGKENARLVRSGRFGLAE